MYLEKNQLLPAFKSAEKKFNENDIPILFSFTQAINLKSSILELIEFNLEGIKGKCYWSQISKNNQFLSFGETLSANTNKIDKATLNLNIEKDIRNSVSVNDTPQIEIPFFIGGQNFNLNQRNSNIWQGVDAASYRVPEFLLIKNDDLITITFFSLINNKTSFPDVYSRYSSYYNSIEKYENKINHTSIKAQSKNIRIRKEEFIENVSEVKKLIDSKDISKIVLSNICEYSLEESISCSSFLESLEKKYPECTVFYYSYTGVFLGASPEQVLHSNQSELMIDALAGSAARGETPGEDTTNQKRLTEDKKIAEEHDIVVKGILESLSKMNIEAECGDIHVLKLKNIQHLKTRIKAKNNSANIMDILDALTPTPALSGYPKDESIKIIENIESYDRGWYSGVVGWIGNNLNADFYAGLRSAYIKDNYIYIYAGAGITIDSIPEDEWNEVINKMSTIDEIINE